MLGLIRGARRLCIRVTLGGSSHIQILVSFPDDYRLSHIILDPGVIDGVLAVALGGDWSGLAKEGVLGLMGDVCCGCLSFMTLVDS